MKDRILTLPLRKEWYGMIECGKKKEEYREIKPFWTSRLVNKDGSIKKFKYVVFSYGYTKRRMCFECKGIYVGGGNPRWGGGGNDVYCIKLGEKVW